MDVVGTIMTEQGLSFAVVQVHAYTVENEAEAQEAIRSYGSLFPGMPLVLMAIANGRPATFWGRRDLATFMASQPPESIPWRTFDVAELTRGSRSAA